MDIFQEWLNLNTPADESQYKRDVELETPLFRSGIMRIWVDSNLNKWVRVEMNGESMSVTRYFRKRRHGKKWMRQQFERTERRLFKGCYPLSMPQLDTFTGEYTLTLEFDEVSDARVYES